ncbi:MAG: 7-cyano-7-deazaguanine synthase [Candidatus Omnitrophica bacterium]|nr:7-cyano-7-deazaguanine synthase [Candidatus Omnitrophota bacterium]
MGLCYSRRECMQKTSPPVCALVSGGLDSAVLVHRLSTTHPRILPVYLRGGLSWEDAELHWLRRFLRAIHMPRLAPLHMAELPLRSLYGAHWSVTGRGIPGARSADAAVYLPGRNALLLTHAAVLAARHRISAIALGILKGNPFGDATPRFFRLIASSLSEALGHPVRIFAPLARSTKVQLIRQASAAGVPLGLTFSCLRPRGLRHCGRCNKCAERRRAFRTAGVPDPTQYVH